MLYLGYIISSIPSWVFIKKVLAFIILEKLKIPPNFGAYLLQYVHQKIDHSFLCLDIPTNFAAFPNTLGVHNKICPLYPRMPSIFQLVVTTKLAVRSVVPWRFSLNRSKQLNRFCFWWSTDIPPKVFDSYSIIFTLTDFFHVPNKDFPYQNIRLHSLSHNICSVSGEDLNFRRKGAIC